MNWRIPIICFLIAAIPINWYLHRRFLRWYLDIPERSALASPSPARSAFVQEQSPPFRLLQFNEAGEYVNTGIYFDGPNRFAVQKAGRKIWSGTPEQFIKIVECGVAMRGDWSAQELGTREKLQRKACAP